MIPLFPLKECTSFDFSYCFSTETTRYLCGFFFWLDAGSTVTLILDLTYVWAPREQRNVNRGFSEACCYDHQSKGSNVRRLTFWYHSPNTFMNVLAPFKEERPMAVLDVLAA